VLKSEELKLFVYTYFKWKVEIKQEEEEKLHSLAF
jgi:hypothetical protein